jgi:serine/threonine protein kinase
LIGQTLSHFKITAKLGEGGMGEVYRADDTQLKREVALKVLPAAMAASPERLERFQREAEAVAALNHPNIVTIHSVEHDQGVHFLTMEMVDGESLALSLQPGALPMAKALRIGAAIADALGAAHDRGVVHRDLKPANVMLTADERVKVLDFGLAKLAREPDGEANEDATSLPTQVKPLTQEGVVLGTAPYMSPEQARGLPADARSDIFSLGCLLYEAATGIRAFSAESSIDTLHRVIHDEPESLANRAPQAPVQLEWILRKALAKDPANRYQSAGEMAVDLRTALRDLESDATLKTPAPMTPPPEEAIVSTRSWKPAAIVATALALVLSLSWLIEQRVADSPGATAPTRSLQQVTSSGLVTSAAISPDGKYIAYTESYRGQQTLNLRQLGSARSLELIPPSPVSYWAMTFTPDSTNIVFGRKDQENLRGALFQISALGGVAKKLVEQMDSPVSFSPDGSQLTWLRVPAPGTSSLMIANADGSDARVLVTRSGPDSLGPRYFTAPSWSPDGRLIAASVMSAETGRGRIVGFDVETGAEAWTSDHSWDYITKVEWFPDGEALLAIAAPDARRVTQIWTVPYPRGAVQQITDDLVRYRLTSLAADGNSLITVADSNDEATLWTQPSDGTSLPVRISHTRADGRWGFDLTTDSRIILQTLEAGQFDLAMMNFDGSERQLLTDDPAVEFFPRVTPQGRILYCVRGDTGEFELRMMESDGTAPKTLSTLQGRYITPALSPDGSFAVIPKDSGLWRLPLDSGEPTHLTTLQGFLPAISPDGRRVAFYYDDGERDGVGILPIEGGELEVTVENVARTSSGSSILRWAEDGEALIINTAPGDRANLWRLPLDGGELERLTNFSDENLFWFEYSPDGETLVVSSGKMTRNALLIQNFR